jgi:hypothetical protein
MKQFLNLNGIDCSVKFITKGSMKGQWRFYNKHVTWYGNKELQNRFIKLGFQNKYAFVWESKHGINDHTGNGGMFSVFLIHPDFTLADLKK